jgi:energy-coupling factor transport system permease protein
MRWSLPFLPMLVLIHAVLNPSHHESVRLSGIVPWRPDGFLLAVTTFASLALLALAAMGWREVRASRLFDDCLRAGLPLRVVVMVAAAASSLDVIRRRIAITYLAQQARGLPSGPGLMARLRALPAVVIPVVTGAITDGAGQGDVMVTRGLGLVPITVDAKGSAGLSPSDAIAAAFPILVTIAAMVIA